MPKKEISTEYKSLLAHHLGGEASDWKRLSKKKVWGGDTRREFENAKLGVKISLYERPDGLLCVELADGSLLTARLSASGTFDPAVKPTTVDQVMNAILEEKEIADDIYATAVKEGLAKRFSFRVCKYEDGIADASESLFATIYPTVRDETFKCPEFIRPLAPKADDTDECMVTEWRFPKGIDTPAQIVKHLQAQGLTWDEKSQEYERAVYKEIKAALAEGAANKPQRPNAKAPNNHRLHK